ncbi:Collagen alpha-4(VI) chain [Varanus komodoensis]|nr:Collagen alpha-4(VI) chain [Varanus komodoensis]
MWVKEEIAKVGLKLNIKKTKILASSPITFWQIDGEEMEVVTDFIFLGSKITTDGDCSQEIKRCLLLGRKAMANLDSILKSRDITLPTKVCIVKAMVFPVAMYGCESWTTGKAERRRIKAFELWCWRRLLLVPWTTRRSNRSVLEEFKPHCSLEGQILKMKHILWPPNEKEGLPGEEPNAGNNRWQKKKGTAEDEWTLLPQQMYLLAAIVTPALTSHPLSHRYYPRLAWQSLSKEAMAPTLLHHHYLDQCESLGFSLRISLPEEKKVQKNKSASGRASSACRESAIADIMFLVDGSWSIGKDNFNRVQDFLYTLVDSFDIGEDKIQIGLIQYTDLPHHEFFLNLFLHKEDILKKIQNLHYKGGGTKTGLSLKFMLDNQFNEMAGSWQNQGVPQIAVVITDGQAQDNISEPAEKVKHAGITVYAIGIKDAVFSELQEIASDPDEAYVFNVEDFASLQSISQNIVQMLCTTVEKATRQITQVFPMCQKATVADIVFLVDSSTSIGLENFEKVKDFLYTLISSFYIGHDQIRIGLAQYSDIIFPEFMLNKYSSKDIILEHIKHLTFRGGSSYTGAALDFITTDYFIESAGSRAQKNIPQMVILFTDGGATDEVKLPASKLRAKGISIYVVGVDIQNTTELKEMASKPFNKFLFTIDNFDLLQDLTSSLLQTVCFDVKSQIEGK